MERATMIAAWLGAAGVALASGTIVGIGVPAGLTSTPVLSASTDGTVICGNAPTAGGETYPFRWTAATGITLLPLFPPTNWRANVNMVSADGTVMVGAAYAPTGLRRAVRWTAAGIEDLGDLQNTYSAEAVACNADGSIIIGTIFRWTAAGGMEHFGATQAGMNLRTMSADGTTYGGWHSQPPTGGSSAAVWSAGAGVVDLGVLNDGWTYASEVVACSADGSVAAGFWSYTAPDTYWSQPFRWTAAGGLEWPRMPYPLGMSARGDVITGYFNLTVDPQNPLPSFAVIWTPYLGTVDLREYAQARGVDLSGWQLTQANGVSADGRVFVGTGKHTVGGTTRDEGFVLTLDAAVPTCYVNCDASTVSPVLNIFDFACFLNRFAAGDTYANCDASTTPPVLNVNDLTCFLNRFTAGCS